MTIDIDADIMREAMRMTGLGAERETVELGLQTLVSLGHQRELRALRGKLEWIGDLNAMRTDD